MNWLFTALLCVVLVELAVRLPFAPTIALLSQASRRSIRTVKSAAISDHWKEKAMAAYARTTFLMSLKLAVLLVILLSIAIVIVLGFDIANPGYETFILTWAGIGASVVFATGYYMARKALLRGRV